MSTKILLRYGWVIIFSAFCIENVNLCMNLGQQLAWDPKVIECETLFNMTICEMISLPCIERAHLSAE